jgi:hypothetical protein
MKGDSFMTPTQRVKRDRQYQCWASPPPKAILLRMSDDDDQTNKILLPSLLALLSIETA